MVRKDVIKKYRPVLNPEVREPLFDLAEGLGFTVTQPGTYLGEPSVTDFLQALAAAYRRDPGDVHLAFKVMGIYNKLDKPEPVNLGETS